MSQATTYVLGVATLPLAYAALRLICAAIDVVRKYVVRWESHRRFQLLEWSASGRYLAVTLWPFKSWAVALPLRPWRKPLRRRPSSLADRLRPVTFQPNAPGGTREP